MLFRLYRNGCDIGTGSKKALPMLFQLIRANFVIGTRSKKAIPMLLTLWREKSQKGYTQR